MALAISPSNDYYCVVDVRNLWPLGSNISAYQSTFGGGTNDIGMVKISNAGVLLYATFIGGSDLDVPVDVFCVNGKICIGASTASTNFPLISGRAPQ